MCVCVCVCSCVRVCVFVYVCGVLCRKCLTFSPIPSQLLIFFFFFYVSSHMCPVAGVSCCVFSFSVIAKRGRRVFIDTIQFMCRCGEVVCVFVDGWINS